MSRRAAIGWATLITPMLSGFFAFPATKDYVVKIAGRDFDTVGFVAAGA